MKHDVITLTETKIDAKVTQKSLSIPGYSLNRQDRTACGGGVATYTRSTLKPVQLSEQQERYVAAGLEVTITKLTLPKPAPCVVVVGVYRPPQTNTDWFTKLDDLVEEVSTDGALVIMGDLNADIRKDDMNPGKALMSSLAVAGMKIHSTEPTRITATSQTCLDIIATDAAIQCSEYRVGTESASDHFPVMAKIANHAPADLKPITKRSFARIDQSELAARVEAIDLGQQNDSTPDTLLDKWNESMVAILDEMEPIRNL